MIMEVTKTGKNYAAALFELAQEKGCEEEYGNALEMVGKIFEQNPKYIDLLTSPAISLSERLSALEKAFSDALPDDILSFLKLLCENLQMYAVQECILEYKSLLNNIKKVKIAKVISAVELGDAEKSALTGKLSSMTDSTVILDCTIDKSILGGIAVEVDGMVFDGTLRRRLKDVKDAMNG